MIPGTVFFVLFVGQARVLVHSIGRKWCQSKNYSFDLCVRKELFFYIRNRVIVFYVSVEEQALCNLLFHLYIL